MQLFHEIYGNYYNTIAAILDQAIRSKVSVNEIEKIVEEKAFCESGLEIMDALRRGKSSTNPKTGTSPTALSPSAYGASAAARIP